MHELLLKNIIARCRDYSDHPSDSKRLPNIGEETAVFAIADLAKKLEAANGLIRSFSAVCDRKGEATNWDDLTRMVRAMLADQHRTLHAEQYVAPRAG
jgi:hypothetical protein